MTYDVSPRNGGKELPSSLVNALGLGAGAALRTVGSALACGITARSWRFCVSSVCLRSLAPPLPP